MLLLYVTDLIHSVVKAEYLPVGAAACGAGAVFPLTPPAAAVPALFSGLPGVGRPGRAGDAPVQSHGNAQATPASNRVGRSWPDLTPPRARARAAARRW